MPPQPLVLTSPARLIRRLCAIVAICLTAAGLARGDGPSIPNFVAVSNPNSAAPYSSWQGQYFTDSQRNDLSISGWNADPDLDGITNGLEYVFNFNPITGITPAEAAAMPHVTNQQPLTNVITYRRRIGVDAKLLFSSDFQNWFDTANSAAQITTTPTGDGVTEDVMVTWTNDTVRFFRVTLTVGPSASAHQWSASVGGNTHYYEVVENPTLSWNDARDYAVDRGGHLAVPTTTAEDTFITSFVPLGAQPYIGGYKQNNTWQWITAEPFIYTDWAATQPDNFNGQEDKIQMVHNNGTWNDTRSTDLNPFVVEYP